MTFPLVMLWQQRLPRPLIPFRNALSMIFQGQEKDFVSWVVLLLA